MPRPSLIWLEPEPGPPDRPALHRDPLLDALLARRGIADEAAAVDFLDAGTRPAPDPFGLPNMGAAAARVGRALATGEPIAVHGDYDADGVTATALLVRALRRAAVAPRHVVPHLPTRADGYGLRPEAVNALADDGANLLIAVDCGSGDHANVALARERGLDVVILDHHQMGDRGPDGAIVVSAQLDPDPANPYRELAAVGVAYLLAVALARNGCRVGDEAAGTEPVDLLDLVALGTIGDVSPLVRLNRALVRDGLGRIRTRPRAGVRALCQRAGVDPRTLTSEQVAFKLAPRVNAAGRMGDPRLALDLLLTDDPVAAARLAVELERLNALRKAEGQRVVAEAEALLRDRVDLDDRRLLVVAGGGWRGGVLGLAAGRLAERFGRPVIVLNDDGELSRGSARSVPGFDITRALAGCGGLLRSHGGHGQAAGLTVSSADVASLEAALEAAIAATDLPPPGPPALRIDADLPAERLTPRTAEALEALQPYGAGNPPPLLRVRGVGLHSYNTIGQDGSHLKLHLRTSAGPVQAVSWGTAARSRDLIRLPDLDLVVTVGIDHWNGRARLAVEAKDFAEAGGGGGEKAVGGRRQAAGGRR